MSIETKPFKIELKEKISLRTLVDVIANNLGITDYGVRSIYPVKNPTYHICSKDSSILFSPSLFRLEILDEGALHNISADEVYPRSVNFTSEVYYLSIDELNESFHKRKVFG